MSTMMIGIVKMVMMVMMVNDDCSSDDDDDDDDCSSVNDKYDYNNDRNSAHYDTKCYRQAVGVWPSLVLPYQSHKQDANLCQKQGRQLLVAAAPQTTQTALPGKVSVLPVLGGLPQGLSVPAPPERPVGRLAPRQTTPRGFAWWARQSSGLLPHPQQRVPMRQ